MSAGDVGAVRSAAQAAAGAKEPRQVAALSPPGAGAPAPDSGSGHEQNRAQLRKAAEDFNRAFTYFDVQAHFSIHEATNTIIIDLVDSSTGEVIREIPPRELLDRYAEMLDLLGLLVDRKA